METAAVFRAARPVGTKAAAFLQFPDVIPARKSLFAGKTAAERERRREVAEAAVNTLHVAAA